MAAQVKSRYISLENRVHINMHPKPERADPVNSSEALPWADWARQYDRLVWLRIVARGIDPDRARELKQEVWELLFRRHHQGLLPNVTMPGLALAQADFLASTERRARPRLRPVPAPDRTDVEGTHVTEPEQLVIDRARLRRVAELVATSSPTTQHVFELHYHPPCLSTEEIAKRLGISEQRVRQVMCELRDRLRRFT